jgi:hypothetical protein
MNKVYSVISDLRKYCNHLKIDVATKKKVVVLVTAQKRVSGRFTGGQYPRISIGREKTSSGGHLRGRGASPREQEKSSPKTPINSNRRYTTGHDSSLNGFMNPENLNNLPRKKFEYKLCNIKSTGNN